MPDEAKEDEAALIQKAIGIVGWNKPDNYSFHADMFEEHHIRWLRCLLPASRPLVQILEGETVRSAVAAYAHADEMAKKEQARYRRISRAILLPLYFSVLIAIVLVLIPPHKVADAIGFVFGSRSIERKEALLAWQAYAPWLVYSGLILTALQRVWFRPADRYRLWQQHRAGAETLRRQVFDRVLDAPPTDGRSSTPWELLLKLEFFRRWQTELQRDYFLKRGRDHERAIRRVHVLNRHTVVVFLLLGLVLAVSLIASFDEQGAPPALLRVPLLFMSRLLFVEVWGTDYWLLLIGLLTANALAYSALSSMLSAAKRNAPRYKNMREHFEALVGTGLQAAREAAARGEQTAVRDYGRQIHAVMTLEVDDWVRLAGLDLGVDKGLRGASEPSSP